MSQVYVLQHQHEKDDGIKEVKFIGVYSSHSEARKAVMRLSLLPGFRDTPDGFHIDEYPVDKDQWAEGFVAIVAAESQQN